MQAGGQHSDGLFVRRLLGLVSVSGLLIRPRRAILEPAADESGVDIAAAKIGIIQNFSEEANCRLDSSDMVFGEGALKAGDSFVSCRRPGGQFRDQRIVFDGNGPATVSAGVDADARSRRTLQRGDPPG